MYERTLINMFSVFWLWRIIISVPIAFAIGLYVGWLRQSKVSIRRLNDITTLASSNASRINDLRDERDLLDRQLEATADDLASAGSELDAEASRLADLHQEASAVIGGLEVDLAATQARIEDLKADLSAAHSRLRELEAALLAANIRSADLDYEPRRPEVDYARTKQHRTRRPRADRSEADTIALSPTAAIDIDRQQDATTPGAPGANQQDDLQAISGIGPKMEELLKSFGIESCEQLAALDQTDMSNLDQIPRLQGRMERDKWTSQARALVANRHHTVNHQ